MRWKFFIPVAVIGGGMIAFYAFFMDRVAETGMEKAGAAIFGARTEVDGLSISLIKGQIKIAKISVANSDEPMTNLFEVGNIVMDVAVNALLMKKIVIEEAVINEIAWNTPRKKSGALAQAAAPEPEETKAEAAPAKEREKPEKKKAKSITVNADFLKSKKDMFKTPKLADKAKLRADEMSAKWPPKMDETDAKLKDASSKVDTLKAIDTDKLKKPLEIRNALKKVKDASKSVKAAVNSVKSVKNEFSADKKEISQLKKDIKKAKAEDWALVSGLAGGPSSAKFRSFTQDILSEMLDKKLGSFSKYIKKTVAVMAKMKEQKEKKTPLKPKKKKFKGRDIHFASMNFPVFWLKHSRLSVAQEGLNMEGEAKNFRTSPEKSNMPATFSMEGRSDGKYIAVKGVFDKRKAGNEITTLNFQAKRYPLNNIGKLPYLKISEFNANYDIYIDYVAATGSETKADMTLIIRDIRMSGDMKDLVTRLTIEAIRDAGKIVIKGSLPIGGAAGDFSSNIDELLSKRIKGYIQEEKKRAQAKAKAAFNDYMGAYEKDAAARLDAFKDKYEKQIDGRMAKASKYQKTVDGLEKKLKDKQKKAASEKTDKIKDKLKSRFKKFR